MTWLFADTSRPQLQILGIHTILKFSSEICEGLHTRILRSIRDAQGTAALLAI